MLKGLGRYAQQIYLCGFHPCNLMLRYVTCPVTCHTVVTLLSHCCHTQRTNFPDRCALLVFVGVNRISASPRPRTLIKSLKIEAQALKFDCPCRVTSEWRRVLLLYMVRHTYGMTKPQCEPHRYQPINHGYGPVGLVVRKYLALREQGAAGI